MYSLISFKFIKSKCVTCCKLYCEFHNVPFTKIQSKLANLLLLLLRHNVELYSLPMGTARMQQMKL